jgi:hypothetical protein
MKTQNVLLAINTVLLATILVFVILIYLCSCRNNALSTEVDSLKRELQSTKNLVDSLQNNVNYLLESNANLSMKVDSLSKLVSELEKCCDKKHRTVKKLQSQIIDTRQQINEKRDSLNEVPIPCPEIDSSSITQDTVKEEISTKILSVIITKTSFYKKTSEQKTLVSYSAPVSFSSLSGFSKDSLAYNYLYSDENNDSSEFKFRSLISGSHIKLNVNKNKDVLILENKLFSLGAGGLQAHENERPFDLNWTSQKFLEVTFDPARKKKGNQEFWPGIILTTAGGVGTWYYATHPIVKVNVYQGDKLIGQDKTYNTPMQIVSGVAVIGGAFLTIKGCLDKKFSYKLTPTELSLKYNLDSK